MTMINCNDHDNKMLMTMVNYNDYEDDNSNHD